MNPFRAFVEGLGSKKLAAVVSAVVAVFLAPVAFKYLGLEPQQLTEVIGGILVPIMGFLFAQWHLDVKTGGQTSTSTLLALKLAQAAEKALPDGTKMDALAKAIAGALADGAAGSPPALLPTPGLPPAPVPPAA